MRWWLPERGNIISFPELDWVEMKRTGRGRQEEEGRESTSYKLDIGKLIVLPIDYIKATPPSVGPKPRYSGLIFTREERGENGRHPQRDIQYLHGESERIDNHFIDPHSSPSLKLK